MSRHAISRFFPIADWLPDCTPKTVLADVIAGLRLRDCWCPGGWPMRASPEFRKWHSESASDQHYQVASQGQGNKTAKRIVGGTGLGALVGGLAGGGKGAAIGAAAGAVAGTTVSAATKGKQVSVPSESLLKLWLQQPVSLPAAR